MSVVGVVAFLWGCATPPQQAIELSQNAVDSKGTELGIVMTAIPKSDAHLRGADCLLCMAVASGANSTLTAHVQTLPQEDLPKLKNDLADLIRKKGVKVTVIPEDLDVKGLPDNTTKSPNTTAKDFSSLQRKYQVSKLLVIDINALGVLRTYAGYVPTSEPKGYLEGLGYIVNLKNNAYEWYMPVKVMRSADQNWDEPPKFPGLTNAYFQALETGRDSFLKPFAK
jgi:hypothetical protein